jgi:HEAT repeat protein
MNDEKNVFNRLIMALLDDSKPFPPSYLHLLSDISPEDLAKLRQSWSGVNPSRRHTLLEDLEELAESDTQMSFDDLGKFALTDQNPEVRAAAARILWECHDRKLVQTYISMVQNDEAEIARAAAASALGAFVYLGELEEVPEDTLRTIETVLLETIRGNDAKLVRRRALEALGYSGREDIPALILDAFNKKDNEWVITSLFAMGRSADQRWEQPILDMLDNPDVDIQTEAIRSSGQLELSSARKPLLLLLKNIDELEGNIRSAAIVAISQIGGEGVIEMLSVLLEASEEGEEADFIEDAIGFLSFIQDLRLPGILEIENGDDDDDLIPLLEDEVGLDFFDTMDDDLELDDLN